MEEEIASRGNVYIKQEPDDGWQEAPLDMEEEGSSRENIEQEPVDGWVDSSLETEEEIASQSNIRQDSVDSSNDSQQETQQELDSRPNIVIKLEPVDESEDTLLESDEASDTDVDGSYGQYDPGTEQAEWTVGTIDSGAETSDTWEPSHPDRVPHLQGTMHTAGQESLQYSYYGGKKRDLDDDFSSDDKVPLKKICQLQVQAGSALPHGPSPPKAVTSPAVASSGPSPPSLITATPPTCQPITPRSPSPGERPCAPLTSDPPIRADIPPSPQILAAPAYTSPIPLPTLLRSQSTDESAEVTPIGPLPACQRPLNLSMSGSFLDLLNSDSALPQADVVGKLDEVLSAISSLSSRVSTLEENVVKLTELLTRNHARPKEVHQVRKAAKPAYKDNMNGTVTIGDENGSIVLGKDDVDGAFALSQTGKDYVLKLLSLAFTPGELASSNFSGGRTQCGNQIRYKSSLRENWKFKSLMVGASGAFPGSTSGDMLRTLKDAVNNKCRKLDLRLRNGQS